MGAGLVAALALAVPALASTSPGTSAAATVPASTSGSATTAIGTVTFSAHNTAVGSEAATGTFAVKGDLLPVTVPGAGVLNQLATFGFSGPVTCLDVQGDRAGLIYPLATASGPVGSLFKGQAIYITVQAASASGPASMGFVGPAPVNSLTSCPPLATFLTVQSGSITVTPAH